MRRFLLVALIWVLIGCKPSNERNVANADKAVIVDTLLLPFGENSSLPRLVGKQDHLYLSWVSRTDSVNHLQFSQFNGMQWTASDTIISGNDWFVNWADFPQINENNGFLLSSFLKKSASGTYTYDVRLNHFNPNTSNWKTGYLLNSDGTQSEHGFVSMRAFGDNGFFVSWLDGRNTIGGHDHSGNTSGAMTLRGAIIDSMGTVTLERELDARVCDCCSTASTITTNSILVAYRDRSEEEVRDISLVRYVEDHWEGPRILGNDQWKISGCPVNGPAIDSYGDSVAVAWFTGANEHPRVQVTFSMDEGKSFGLPLRIDSGNAIGRVDITMLNHSEVAVSWMEPDGDDTVIRVRKVGYDGTMGIPLTIAKTSMERASGFPQMELFNDRLYFAWTQNNAENSQIKMASLSLEVL